MFVSSLAEFFAIVFVFLGGPAPGACFDRTVKNVELFFLFNCCLLCFWALISVGFSFKLSSDVLC